MRVSECVSVSMGVCKKCKLLYVYIQAQQYEQLYTPGRGITGYPPRFASNPSNVKQTAECCNNNRLPFTYI